MVFQSISDAGPNTRGANRKRPMSVQQQRRILIYSHDSFGLGHLRRCRTIAHALVDHREDVTVLIISGSPVAGSFGLRRRVDVMRIPGMKKLRSGNYAAMGLNVPFEKMVNLRGNIIRATAESFDPHVFLVDKEPLGLGGELAATLGDMHRRGVRNVLGLRDVMDESHRLRREWARKNAMPALVNFYDSIIVYGLRDIHDPLDGVGAPPQVREKLHYTGYIWRTLEQGLGSHDVTFAPGESFFLVTPGGGGDGGELVDWVIRAYEHDPTIPERLLIVFGPFMSQDLQVEFRNRAERLQKVHTITFDPHLETLMATCDGVIAMGGYNTFCEILSVDKPSILVPRTVPRMEQFIRVSKAAERGLVHMLPDDGIRDPIVMATAIRKLRTIPRPSEQHIPGLLDGLSTIKALFDRWLNEPTDDTVETLTASSRS